MAHAFSNTSGKVTSQKTSFIAFTDSCGLKDRSIKIGLHWLHVANDISNRVCICDQKFFMPSHTYMSCDRDLGVIENLKPRHTYIFLPDYWVQLIKCAFILFGWFLNVLINNLAISWTGPKTDV